MKIPSIVYVLKMNLVGKKIVSEYLRQKEKLLPEFQDIDDEIMISHAKGYIAKVYEEKSPTEQVELLLRLRDSLQSEAVISFLVGEFIKCLNALKANIGDPVHETALYKLKELEQYEKEDIYKKISQENNRIAKIIKEYYGYVTIGELKAKCHDEPRGGKFFKEYIVSEEEIKLIEAVKKCPVPNQMAHLIYDTRKNNEYHCDHEIRSESDALKQLLVSTNKDSPRYNIIFEDGTIVCYNEGDIRVRPYKFGQVLRYTKLFFAKNYETMLNAYTNPLIFSINMEDGSISITNDSEVFEFEPDSEFVTQQMVINSFINVINMLNDYEDVYTKKIIEDSKQDLEKAKELTKKYQF